MEHTTSFYLSALGVVSISGLIGVLAGRRVKTSKGFSVGGKRMGIFSLIGMLMTIAGGAATIGGAQAAFEYGLTGCAYTFGRAFSCLFMGLFYARRMNDSDAETIPQFIGHIFGFPARIACSATTSVALFMQIASQLLSSVALLYVAFGWNYETSIAVSIVMILLGVLFGGAWSTGSVGMFRTILLYCSLLAAGEIAYRLAGGMAGFHSAFPPYPWFSFFGRGMHTDGAGLLSVVVGFLSTQQILQAMFAGKDVRTCRDAAFVSAALLPFSGFACVAIGIYMRISSPHIPSAQALPLFLLEHAGALLGGLTIGALFLAVVGTSSAVILGISLMLTKDIYHQLLRKDAGDRELLTVNRTALVAVLLCASFLVRSKIDTMILSWAFLSMSLRAASVFLPILAAMYARLAYTATTGAIAVSAGPLAILLNTLFFEITIHPLYLGLGASAMFLLPLGFRNSAVETPSPKGSPLNPP